MIWIAVIASESSFGSTSNTSRILRPLLEFLFPHITAAHFAVIHDAIRKAGHLTGYAILSFLAYRSWWTTLHHARQARGGTAALSWRMMLRQWRGRAVMLALLTTLAIAGADEFHQHFDPRRTASVGDVLLDEMGGWLAQSMLLIVSSVSLPERPRRRDAVPERVTSS